MFLRHAATLGDVPPPHEITYQLARGPRGGVVVGDTELPPDAYLSSYFKGKGGYWGEVFQPHGKIGTLKPGGKAGVFFRAPGDPLVEILWPVMPAAPQVSAPISQSAPYAPQGQKQVIATSAPPAPVSTVRQESIPVVTGSPSLPTVQSPSSGASYLTETFGQQPSDIQPLTDPETGAPVTSNDKQGMLIAGGALAIAALILLMKPRRRK